MTATIPQPREDLRVLRAYGVKGNPDAIQLGANEWTEPNPMGRYITPEAMENVLLNRYPGKAAAPLERLLGEWYGITPDQITFGNGSNDTLLSVFLIFGGHGSKTLLFAPTYSMHSRLTTIAGGTVATEMIGLPYRVTKERALAAMERERPEIVCFCTPNNPTGTLVDDDVILAVAEAYPETVVLVDEAYSDIPGKTLLPALVDHPNLIISRTFSKVFAAAGLRLGFLVLHPLLAESIRAIQFAFNVSAVSFSIATEIAKDEAGVRRRVEQVRSERERVYRALCAIDGIEVFPSDANFILFRTPGDAAAIDSAFLDQGVQIRNMTPWPGCDGCLRVTIGTPEENDLFIAAADAVLAGSESLLAGRA